MSKFDFRVGDKVQLRNGDIKQVYSTDVWSTFPGYPVRLTKDMWYTTRDKGKSTFYDTVRNISQEQRENRKRSKVNSTSVHILLRFEEGIDVRVLEVFKDRAAAEKRKKREEGRKATLNGIINNITYAVITKKVRGLK